MLPYVKKCIAELPNIVYLRHLCNNKMAEILIDNAYVLDYLKENESNIHQTAIHLSGLACCQNKNVKSLDSRIRVVRQKNKDLRRNSSSSKVALEDFLKQPFSFPTANPDPPSPR